MVRRCSIAEAGDDLPTLVREAERGVRVELLREGRPVAAIVGVSSGEQPTAGSEGFWSALQEFRRTHDLTGIDPDEVFKDVRDPSSGRDFSW